VWVLTCEEMREVDRATIEDFGTPSVVLMEKAGMGVFATFEKRWGSVATYFPNLVVCGTGNNGGDGFVVARLLLEKGYDVEALLVGSSERLKGDAAVNYRLFVNSGGMCTEVPDEKRWEAWEGKRVRWGVIFDALFGTGLKSEVRGVHRSVIDWINTSTKLAVISVDIPSGGNGTTGEVLGACVRANTTVTMAAPKVGFFLQPLDRYVGDLVVAEIGVPNRVWKEKGPQFKHLLCTDALLNLLPFKGRFVHKGERGKVLVVGGNRGYGGAINLAAKGASVVGSGLVYLLAPPSATALTDLTLDAVKWGNELLTYTDLVDFLEEGVSLNALLVGPGMSRENSLTEVLKKLLYANPYSRLPAVVDADGLHHLKEVVRTEGRREGLIITPHLGEAAALLDTTVEWVKSHYEETLKLLHERYADVVVLKSHYTWLYDGERYYINARGSSAMAKGGSGDVLSGFIVGLLAGGLSPIEAGALGVYLHALCGEAVEREKTELCGTPLDLIHKLPEVIKERLGGELPR